MMWITPPECQGQIVTYSYAATPDGCVYRRRTDASEPTDAAPSFDVADCAECGCDGECNCFDPANREPSGYDWVPCEDPRPRYDID